ncbi:hypothetical protein QBC44DRAFT_1586 [Cladorrhinum sp. PSN332]|nr:hypothetical protein QBC44DRAFT_1586 [Cladorrhinum sp. PSN332]
MVEKQDASTCPENLNSTDCLLRLVLTAIEKERDQPFAFNWDAITFGFTAPIGIFAAVFAAVTIYQAILASAGGRRKSNRRAIGPWAKRTTHEWNWGEFTRLSIATTPVLRAESVLQLITSKFGFNAQFKTESPQEFIESDHKSRHDLPTATWFRFLKHIALDELTLNSPLWQPVEITMADHLPGDLLAVPAYAEVGFIVAAAAAAGMQSLTVSSEASQHPYKYPVIVGNGWQFDFRQHPTLGTIAAFSSYGTGTTQWRRRCGSPDCLGRKMCRKVAAAISHSRGHVAIPGSPITMACTRNQRVNKLQSLLGEFYGAANSPRMIMGAPDDAYGLSWILLVDPPTDYIPAIFPTRLVRRNTSVLSMIALNSKFWSSPTLSKTRLHEQMFRIIPGITTLAGAEGDLKEIKSYYWRSEHTGLPDETTARELEAILHLVEHGKYYELSGVTGNTDLILTNFESTVSPFVLPSILEHCVAIIQSYDEFQSWFRQLSPFEKQFFRATLVLQIRHVNTWIEAVYDVNGVDGIQNTVARILSVTLALLKAEELFGKESSSRKAEHSGRLSLDLVKGWYQQSSPLVQHLATISNLDHHITSRRQKPRKLFDAFWVAGATYEDLEGMLDRLYEMLTNQSRPNNDIFFQDFRFSKRNSRQKRRGPENQDKGATERNEVDQDKTFGDIQDEPEPGSVEDPPTNGSGDQETPKDRPRIAFKNRKNYMKEERTPREVLEDVLVWRSIMVAMLFYTAPDNSDLLRSGIWEHVVPVI